MVKNAKKAEENAKSAEKECVATEKVLNSLKEEHAKLDDKAEAVLNTYNAMKEELVEFDQVLNTLRARRDEVIQNASTLKSQEVDLVNEMEEKTRVLRELHGRIEAWGSKLKEARKEYEQLPLDILGDLRSQQTEGTQVSEEAQCLARQAISKDLSGEELEVVDRSDIDARMLTLEANLKNLKPNLSSIEEFRRADTEHKARLADYDSVNDQ